LAGLSAKHSLAAAGSDPGRVRENNEDRTLCDPELGIYAVVDGVGGESGGEIAAQTAVEILRARLSRRTTDTPRLIREAIALANKQIWEKAQADPALAGMACVLTVAVVDGAQATIGHVGDSRLYLLRPGEIRKITRDHSPVGAREDVGEISEAEAMSHPRRNEIFRDVGSGPHEPDEEGFIDVTQIRFEPDSALLICSDGLSDLVTSQSILSLVESNAANPKAAVQALIDAANQAGGKDNVSVVLVEGERFAAAARKSRPEAATAAVSRAATSRTSPRGAGAARSGAGSRILGAFASRPAVLLYGAILGAFAFAAFGQGLGLHLFEPGPRPASAGVLRVGAGDGGTATIAEALAQARPGATVEVAPGTYREALQLRTGVALVSRVPRGAVILPPVGSGVPAIAAQGVEGARIAGFRIAGDAQAPLQVGIRLADSAVEVEGVEITGAQTAGIDIAGADRSAVRHSFVHDNPGDGVLVEAGAAPRLLSNLISGNGRAPGALRPGVEVAAGAQAELVENRFLGNGGGGVLLASPERGDEIFAWNSFPGLGRAEAVRSPAPAAAQPAAAPRAPAPGRPASRRPGR
jgi:serine/threonine protein phosphatase PrpC